MTTRNLFAEIDAGLDALGEQCAGKRTLRTHTIEHQPVPDISPEELVSLRQKLKEPLIKF